MSNTLILADSPSKQAEINHLPGAIHPDGPGCRNQRLAGVDLCETCYGEKD